jgi:hypothetical protein
MAPTAWAVMIGMIIGGMFGFLMCAVLTMGKITDLLEDNHRLRKNQKDQEITIKLPGRCAK